MTCVVGIKSCRALKNKVCSYMRTIVGMVEEKTTEHAMSYA